jgi:NDP-sugar pyrophosphorylase family protein
LVVDSVDRLVDTVTDGDIRRAILSSASIDSSVQLITEKKRAAGGHAPIVATDQTSSTEILELMLKHKILHVPLLDDAHKVVGLKLMRDLIPEAPHEFDAMIMAGGFGKRLMPLTQDTPKPMLEVGGKPILERIIGQLRSAEVKNVVVATHHLPESITNYFGSGENFGVEIEYVHEHTPLGTAGALGLLPKMSRPLLVMNGDIVTNVDFRAMLAFHEENAADITVGVARYQFQVPYGVVECEGSRIVKLSEKPQISAFVSAGIYLVSPGVVNQVERGKRMDMPDIINRVVEQSGIAVSFPIVEYWLDIGSPTEFERAQTESTEI